MASGGTGARKVTLGLVDGGGQGHQVSIRRGGACVNLARWSGSPGGSRPRGIQLLGLSAEREPALRKLLFWVSLTGRLLGGVGMSHSHSPFRQQSHQEVKSLPEVEQV